MNAQAVNGTIPAGEAPAHGMVHVRIRYCGPCGYRGRAEALGQVIQNRFRCEVRLEAGNFGVFKVWVGDRLVFDKRSTRGWLGKLGFGEIPPDDVICDLLTTANR